MALRAILLCMLTATATSKVVFEETWDVHPILKYNKLEFEFFGDPGSFNVDVANCPGGRHELTDDYRHCLFLDLRRCENPNFPEKGGCFRNEIGLRDERNIFDYERTYYVGMSFFVPEDFEYDDLKTLHCQIKANGGAFFSPGGPSFSLITQYGMWGMGIRGSSDCLETCKIETGIMEYFAVVEPGKWVDFVWETRISYIKDGPGYGRMWMNGHVVYEKYNIMTTYKDPFDQGVFVKWGVYKHQWGEGDQGEFMTEYMSMFLGNVRVARGKKGWDEADPSPQCYDIETCCNTCIDGKENQMYNARRCLDRCSEVREKRRPGICSAQASSTCTDIDGCCQKCVDGRHNPAYDTDVCFSRCRAEEQEGNADRARFKRNCFRLAFDGCSADRLQCGEYGSICDQGQYSFGCRCPIGETISNKDGRECRATSPAKIKNPDTFPGVTREED